MYGPAKDEWEVVSRLSVGTLGVLYSNVNGDIRHGVQRCVWGGAVRDQCVCVCV